MRLLTVGLLLFVAGCRHDLAGPRDLTGTWSEPITIPGAGFGFTLSQVRDSVFGSGGYSIEAGPHGTVTVSGRYDPPSVSLRFLYDNGRRLDFAGQVAGVKMIGTETDSLGASFSAVFVKQ